MEHQDLEDPGDSMDLLGEEDKKEIQAHRVPEVIQGLLALKVFEAMRVSVVLKEK